MKPKKLNFNHNKTSEETEKQLDKWFRANNILVKQTAHLQYKILNGIVKNIMFYPTTMTLMFQDISIYVWNSNDKDTVLALIHGQKDYKQLGE